MRDAKHAINLAVYAIHPELQGESRKWTRLELPDFQQKRVLTQTLNAIGATISPVVDAAVSFQSRVLDDLPTVRNYYAHKSERAARGAATVGPHYGITRPMTPHELLCEVPRGRGDILLREWLADLSAILSLMP
jgi:hypothetical protein